MSRKPCRGCGNAQAVRPGGLCNSCFKEAAGVQKTECVPLNQIRTDGGTQARCQLSESTVADYAEAMAAGDVLPPLVVFFDGSYYWLAGGFHRYFGHKKNNDAGAECIIKAGTKRDAVLYAAGDNATHGLQRTSADKEKAVKLLLEDLEWSKASVEWLAKAARVSWSFADKIKKKLQPEQQEDAAEPGDDEYPPPEKLPDAPRFTGNQTPAREPQEPAAASPVAVVLDRTGAEVPERLRVVFEWDEQFNSALQHLRQVRTEFNTLINSEANRHLKADRQKLESELENLRRAFRFARPLAVCPYCEGDDKPMCRACNGSGWVNETIWESAPPDIRGNVNVEIEE